MPAPLIWLSAACLGLYASNKANNQYLKRKKVVSAMPGESEFIVQAVNGSIVTCGIYGVLDHTGIWVNGNIYELSGEGLVRCLSPARFLGKRSGSKIYVACNELHQPLYSLAGVERAQQNLYSLKNYHLYRQNCHKFVAETLADKSVNIVSFSDLNKFLHQHFNSTVHWNMTKIK